MTRGEVWWANLSQPTGTRPVVLLSPNSAYSVRAYIIVAPVMRRVRNIPAEVRLGPEDGMPQPCVVNLDVIDTISKTRLLERITLLNPEKVQAVDAAIRFALGLGG
jgi:mRNA interferase MazF